MTDTRARSILTLSRSCTQGTNRNIRASSKNNHNPVDLKSEMLDRGDATLLIKSPWINDGDFESDSRFDWSSNSGSFDSENIEQKPKKQRKYNWTGTFKKRRKMLNQTSFFSIPDSTSESNFQNYETTNFYDTEPIIQKPKLDLEKTPEMINSSREDCRDLFPTVRNNLNIYTNLSKIDKKLTIIRNDFSPEWIERIAGIHYDRWKVRESKIRD